MYELYQRKIADCTRPIESDLKSMDRRPLLIRSLRQKGARGGVIESERRGWIWVHNSIASPVCTAVLQVFGAKQEFAGKSSLPGNSCGHFEEVVYEPILTPDSTRPQPPHLAFGNYVQRLIALNRSARCVEFSKPLLGIHSPFDRPMVLFDGLFRCWTGRWRHPLRRVSTFLMYDDGSIDEAIAAAEMDISHLEADLLVRIARAIGTAMGRGNRR